VQPGGGGAHQATIILYSIFGDGFARSGSDRVSSQQFNRIDEIPIHREKPRNNNGLTNSEEEEEEEKKKKKKRPILGCFHHRRTRLM
jgi:hypothetical protein